MVIYPVSNILGPENLIVPTLNALVPNEVNYKVLLLQPKGEVEGSAEGVWNRNRDLSRNQYARYLEDARATQSDLVITPEYSMPWDVLTDAIKGGGGPTLGKLWVLGCESIKYSQLDSLKQSLGPYATVLYELLEVDPRRFLDPLVYVFMTADGNGRPRTVLLVQFKTHPMGDNDHFEINGLQRGTNIYQFGSNGQSVRLVSLICSDVFAFLDEHALEVYDRGLIVHIQLNPKPRQEIYRQYRDRLMRCEGYETELICLNWAENVHEWCGVVDKPWQNIAGSAWYLRPDKFDKRDEMLCHNHKRGLYYTWLKSLRSHALFFNYQPATYLIEATKVAHIGVPTAVSRRRGPLLTGTSVWDDVTAAWVEQGAADDGFSALAGESGRAEQELKRIAADNPIAAERVLALCAGEIGQAEDWHNVGKLDSCIIDASEIICRITFCQDTDEKATKFRVARLKRCGNLWNILKTNVQLPAALSDFMAGFRFEWSPHCPHQNALSHSGKRATVIYMGEESSIAHTEEIFKKAAEYLRRGISNPDDRHNAQQRLAVWYRDDDQQIQQYSPDRFIRFDDSGNTSELDIRREK